MITKQNTKDAASNIVSVVTETPASGGTVVTQTRTVNTLNQITENSVNTVTVSPPANTTVNANYTYDASGNRATMVVGGNTTTYTWDDDNRLTQVVLPGNVTIGYTYDALGRMLSRTDSNGTATFVWDGMDCVQETDYLGNVTRYYTVKGRLLSFDRQGTVYQVHVDALGSVRKVTDPTGSVAATYDYDAWGNQLASTSDSIPDGGLQYRFVGARGVRWDSTAGLYYARQRWYDPVLARFISRDRKLSANSYVYANNAPTSFVDASGLDTCPAATTDIVVIVSNEVSDPTWAGAKKACAGQGPINPFGHIALAFGGMGTYSYPSSVSGGAISNTYQYALDEAASVPVSLYILRTTHQQNLNAMNFLQNDSDFSYYNNCATHTSGALYAAGFAPPDLDGNSIGGLILTPFGVINAQVIPFSGISLYVPQGPDAATKARLKAFLKGFNKCGCDQ